MGNSGRYLSSCPCYPVYGESDPLWHISSAGAAREDNAPGFAGYGWRTQGSDGKECC